jgi:ABC-2 type transport system permease protein
VNGVRLVAGRELRVQATSKGFLIGLVITALIVMGAIAGPRLLGSPDTYKVGVTGQAAQALKPALAPQASAAGVTVKTVPYADEAAARAAVAGGDADAAIVDGPRVLTDGDLEPRLAAVVQGANRTVQSRARLAAAGIDATKVDRALNVPQLATVSVTGDTRYESARKGIAALVVIALFMLLMSSAMGVAMGVVEEKSSRIVEILLIAVRPWQLLAGKIAAFGVLGLAQLAVIAAAGLGAAAATGATPDLPPGTAGIIVGAAVGYLLGYLFFAAGAAALGALVSRQEELSSALSPMTMLMMAVYGVGFWALADPHSTANQVLSMVPPFSSMVMPVRAAATDVPMWQFAVAAAGMLAAAGAVLFLGARVYERAILRTGARVRLLDALRASA